MEEISQPRALDTILEYCISKGGEHIYDHQIETNVFPELNVDQIRHLFGKIEDTVDEIAIVNINEDTAIIRSTGMTQTFLDQGGFVQVSLDEKREETEAKERDNIEFEKSKIDLELAKRMLKEYPKTKWFARFGFFIGIGLALLELIKFLIPILFPSDKT